MQHPPDGAQRRAPCRGGAHRPCAAARRWRPATVRSPPRQRLLLPSARV